MKYPQRPTTHELRQKEYENRLRRKQNLWGLAALFIGATCTITLDALIGITFVLIGGYFIVTKRLVLE